MLLTRALLLTTLAVLLTSADAGRRRRRRRLLLQGTPEKHTTAEGEGVPVGSAAPAPTCPPMAATRRRTPSEEDLLCGAPACLLHQECPSGRGCCFNGCVHTCLLQVDSPPVIDWLVDTSALLPILEDSGPPELPTRYEDLSFAEGREEAVRLPGGCTITGSQFSRLQEFMEAPSIESCKCDQGEVVCAVRMLQS